MTDIKHHWEDALANNGWHTFARHYARPSLADIATALDLKRVKADRLIPKPQKLARKNTLSSRYGMESFPLHSDYVLHTVSPRYLVLFAPNPRGFGTTIWDSWQLPATLTSQAIFLVDQPGHRRYARFEIGTRPNGQTRYNSAFFRPMNQAAQEVADQISQGENLQAIDWHQNSAAIIDNWRILHGREPNRGDDHASIIRVAGWRD